jgi:ribosome-associated protein
MIPVTDAIALDEAELVERFVRASGPGGQHVNKTSTAVELRFDVRGSAALPDDVKARLEALAGARLTQDGVIVLVSQGTRSQEMNRQEVRERLFALIRQAAIRPKPRRRTRPTLASKQRRLEAKARRARVKSMRGRPIGES